MKPMRLTALVVAVVVTALVAGMSLFATYTIDEQRELLRRELERDATTLARGLAASSAAPLLQGHYDVIEELLLRFAQVGAVRRLAVFDAQGKTVGQVERTDAGTPRADYGFAVVPPQRLQQQAAATPAIRDTSQGPRLQVTVPVETGTTVGWVEVVISTEAIGQAARQLLRDSLLALLGITVAMVVLVGLALMPARRHLREAVAFAQQLKTFTADRLREDAGPKELRQLAKALNEASLALREQHDDLEASEARKTAVLQSALDCIVMINAAGAVVDFNPAAERVFGYRRAEVLNRDMAELIVPPQHREGHRQGMARYLATGEARVLNRRIEIDAMRADGTMFPVELTVVPAHVGSSAYFAATLRDITDRKAAEGERERLLADYRDAAEKLRSQKQAQTQLLQQYRTVLTDLERQQLALDEHAVVSITDAEGRIVHANDRLAELSGYRRDQLIGQTHSMLKSGRHPPEYYRQLWETVTAGRVWHGELINRRRDGRLYWVASTIVPVPGDDGRPRQYISIQTDISALRQAEEALARARSLELRIGSRIQGSLLVTPPRHMVDELWVSAFNQASQQIDGDFVEVIQTDRHCLDIITGDVMGKGVPAALMGAATKLQFSRSLAELTTRLRGAGRLPQPIEIVSAVHRAMSPHLQALDSFVTVCYVRIDTERRRVTWVGCGHEETLLLRASDDAIRLQNQHPPIGLTDELEPLQGEVPLRPGEALFLCSDGIADALRDDGQREGRDRLAERVRGVVAAHPTPAAALSRLRRQLIDEKLAIADDVTMVLVRNELRLGCERRELACDLQALRELRSLVRQQGLAAGMSPENAGLLELACAEAFTNIVRHGRDLLDDAPIELVVQREDDGVRVDLVYVGEYFRPTAVAAPDPAQLPEGGFGLSIIEGVCDRVQYLTYDGVNTIRLYKAAAGQGQSTSITAA